MARVPLIRLRSVYFLLWGWLDSGTGIQVGYGEERGMVVDGVPMGMWRGIQACVDRRHVEVICHMWVFHTYKCFIGYWGRR